MSNASPKIYYYQVTSNAPMLYGQLFYMHYEDHKLAPLNDISLKEHAFDCLNAFGYPLGMVRVLSIKKVKSVPQDFKAMNKARWIYV